MLAPALPADLSAPVAVPAVAARMRRALALTEPGETPVLLVDPSAAVSAACRLRELLPGVDVLYAVKANPHPPLLRALVGAGVGFDVASLGEVDAALAAGAAPSQLSFGAPVKPRRSIAVAFDAGVRDFAVDSAQEITKIAAVARGARVHVRLTVDQTGADWPLGGKYGVGPREALRLLHLAVDSGLEPAGVTFHVGSQQRLPQRWADALRTVGQVLRSAAGEGLSTATVDLGGGWPTMTRTDDPDVEACAATVREAVREHLPAGVKLVAEPGRHLAAAAGVLVAEVIGTASRPEPWAFLDAGLFHGLIEAEGEVTRYPVTSTAHGLLVPTTLAGPTCDSADVLYRSARPLLPTALAEGDLVAFGGAGAYTSTYSSVGFNGLRPVAVRSADLSG